MTAGMGATGWKDVPHLADQSLPLMLEVLTEHEQRVDEIAEAAGLRQFCVSELPSCLGDCVPVIIG